MSLRYKGGVISSVAPTTSGTPYTGVAQGIWSMEDQIQAKAAGLWPKAVGVPDAPTIGGSTGGDAQVIQGFAAPADNGGSAITGYTVTSSPGNISASGASSPITVTGLTNETTYTFTVVATNAIGNSVPSAASSPITPSETVYRDINAIFAFGGFDVATAFVNLVSNTGVVATATTVTATNRYRASGAPYGVGNAVIAFGANATTYAATNIQNTVNNLGVVSSDTTASPASQRAQASGAGYGTDKAIFGYGSIGANYSTTTNLVSNTGVFASNVTSPSPSSYERAAATYGTDKAIFGFGNITGTFSNQTNLVSNTGVVANAVTTVGDLKYQLAAAGYGFDKAIFGFGAQGGVSAVATINLISNTGTMAATTTSVGTARQSLAGATYGSDKAIFSTADGVNFTNLVSNTGVVAADVAGVGATRYGLTSAASYN